MFDIHKTSAAAYSVAVVGDEFRYRDTNQAAVERVGFVNTPHPGLTPHDCFSPALADTIVARYRACRDSKTAISYVFDKGSRAWRTTLFPEMDASGTVVALIGILVDATQEAAPARSSPPVDDKISFAMDVLDGGFWVYDLATSNFETSKPLAELLAGPGAQPLNLAEYANHLHEEDIPAGDLLRPPTDRSTVEYRVIAYDGRTRWLRSKRRVVTNDQGTPVSVVGLVVDVTKEKAAIRSLETQASTDCLTSLTNRRAFDRIAVRSFDVAKARKEPIGLIMIDLDGFKPINDRYGHRAGDEILRKVAQRISRCVRRDDTLARLGGDEFALLMPKSTEEAVDRLALKMHRAFEKPFHIGDEAVFVGVSVGTTVSTPGDPDFAAVFERADQALYAMKSERRLLIA